MSVYKYVGMEYLYQDMGNVMMEIKKIMMGAIIYVKLNKDGVKILKILISSKNQFFNFFKNYY